MSYDGGKGGAGVYQWIINQIPPHKHFISLFLGNCAVTRYKRPAHYSVGVEINPRVIADYWREHTIPGLIVTQGDAISFLDTPGLTAELDEETFLYADPPYLITTRSQQRPLYEFELMDVDSHRALLSRLRRLPCMVAISGYWSELYELELAGWRTSTFWTVNRAGDRVQEWLWMNYPEPFELHDYRYLGRDYRERERIKRKKARWTAKLRAMPELERLALMEAIGELRSTTAAPGDGARAAPATPGDADDPAGSDEGISSLELTMAAGTATSGDAFRIRSPGLTIAAPTLGYGDAPAPHELARVAALVTDDETAGARL